MVGDRDDGIGDGNATSALGYVEGKTNGLRVDQSSGVQLAEKTYPDQTVREAGLQEQEEDFLHLRRPLPRTDGALDVPTIIPETLLSD